MVELKRFIDVLVAMTLVILASPVLAVTAIVIKLDSKGPVIFKQERVGKDMKPFEFFKFRSMRVGSDHAVHEDYIKKLMMSETDEEGKVYKLTRDPRITRIGNFIRKTSIDELPQLFNVLKGDMSMVGPRPAIPYELKYHDATMLKRFSVKPGITGLWQVSGRSRVGYKQMTRMDIFYIEHWSIWLDVKILFRTVWYILDMSRAF